MISRKAVGRLNIVFFAAGLILLASLLIWTGPEKVLQSLLAANPIFLLLALIPLFSAIFLRIIKTSIYFMTLGIYSGMKNSAAFTLSVQFMGSVSPFRSGEIMTGLAVEEGKRQKSTSVVVIDRFLETLATLILIFVSTFFFSSGFIDQYRILLLIGAAFLILTFVIYFGERLWGFKKHIRQFSTTRMLILLGLAIAGTFLESFILYFILHAFSIDVSVSTAIFLQQTANVIAFAASIPGGIGSREAYLVAVLSGSGFETAAILTTELTYKLILWLIVIPLGAISFLSLKNKPNLRGNRK